MIVHIATTQQKGTVARLRNELIPFVLPVRRIYLHPPTRHRRPLVKSLLYICFHYFCSNARKSGKYITTISIYTSRTRYRLFSYVIFHILPSHLLELPLEVLEEEVREDPSAVELLRVLLPELLCTPLLLRVLLSWADWVRVLLPESERVVLELLRTVPEVRLFDVLLLLRVLLLVRVVLPVRVPLLVRVLLPDEVREGVA